MELITSLTLYSLILSFFFGQLFRITMYGLSFPLIDFFITSFSLLNLYQHFKTTHLKPKNTYFLYFLIFSWFTLIVNLVLYHYPVTKPISYLIRLSSLLLLFIFPPDSHVLTKKIKIFFTLSIIANIIFGLFQYLVWPDFTNFKVLNWDPHLYRLVSTYFDPTFTGLIYLLFLLFLYFLGTQTFGALLNKFLMIITYLGIALTYSRSTFLSLSVASLFISLQHKKPKIFVLTTTLVLLTVLLLPRAPGEGTKLERTSSIKAKIENYREGIGVFVRSPIIGHGYNNLPYVRNNLNQNSHSNAGFDGSLLTILSSTGIIGLTLFCIGSINLYRHSSILHKSLLVSIFVHSLFANSMLYPWILVFLFMI
jgi:hypothetical protein